MIPGSAQCAITVHELDPVSGVLIDRCSMSSDAGVSGSVSGLWSLWFKTRLLLPDSKAQGSKGGVRAVICDGRAMTGRSSWVAIRG